MYFYPYSTNFNLPIRNLLSTNSGYLPFTRTAAERAPLSAHKNSHNQTFPVKLWLLYAMINLFDPVFGPIVHRLNGFRPVNPDTVLANFTPGLDARVRQVAVRRPQTPC